MHLQPHKKPKSQALGQQDGRCYETPRSKPHPTAGKGIGLFSPNILFRQHEIIDEQRPQRHGSRDAPLPNTGKSQVGPPSPVTLGRGNALCLVLGGQGGSRNPPASQQGEESPCSVFTSCSRASSSCPQNPPHHKPAGCLTSDRDCFDSLRQETASWDHWSQPPKQEQQDKHQPGLAPQLAPGSAGLSPSLSGDREPCSRQLCLGLHLLRFSPRPSFTAGAGKLQLALSSGLETAPASQVPETS